MSLPDDPPLSTSDTSRPKKRAPLTGIVLSGGGARGAYEAGVIKYIRDELPPRVRAHARFEIVTGTSVGAINACFLAARSPRSGSGCASRASTSGLPREAAITRDRNGADVCQAECASGVWTGDPLETTTSAELVLIGGEQTSLDTRQKQLSKKYQQHESQR